MSLTSILEQILQAVINYILIPAVLAIISVVFLRCKEYIKSLAKSFAEKQENDSSTAIANIITNVLAQLEIIVESAVSANMVFAERYKAAAVDGKLTEEEIKELQGLAKQLAYDTIPTSIKSGDILELLGGQEVLDKLITGLIERALINIKAKSPITLTPTTALESFDSIKDSDIS